MKRDLTPSEVILICIVFFGLLAGMTSCATNGYGCKGRGKLITRVPQ